MFSFNLHRVFAEKNIYLEFLSVILLPRVSIAVLIIFHNLLHRILLNFTIYAPVCMDGEQNCINIKVNAILITKCSESRSYPFQGHDNGRPLLQAIYKDGDATLVKHCCTVTPAHCSTLSAIHLMGKITKLPDIVLFAIN